MGPGFDFSGMFQCILTLTCFYIPKYTLGMYEAERKYPVIKKISTKRHQEQLAKYNSVSQTFYTEYYGVLYLLHSELIYHVFIMSNRSCLFIVK